MIISKYKLDKMWGSALTPQAIPDVSPEILEIAAAMAQAMPDSEHVSIVVDVPIRDFAPHTIKQWPLWKKRLLCRDNPGLVIEDGEITGKWWV
jgi:hypothetical protein